ncbi:MAG TPA: DHA2 family efflux MFS transporter permease subunit [Rhizomicrobium sp.]|nr:DHA2 family efflux MFS transporter permease subunit [Rhizomicrobium sp.]
MSGAGAQAAGPPPMVGVALAVTALALAMGTFMQVLDSTIANVSLPTIAGNLGASTDQGTWVITAFAVSNGIGVPLTGWLMGRYGVVRIFVLSVLAFTIASFLCGIAWSLPSLIFFRVLQGGVSGPMIPGSQALLISIFPADKRATALGIWSITTLVAPICGPILGGYISDNIHWGWIFLINVPVGLIVTFLCWQALKSRETPTRQLPIDMVGLGLLILWVGALQVMLDTGKDAGWFESTRIVVLALITAIGFVAFLIWELTEKYPIVDLTLFKSRNFALGCLAFCLGYAVFFANTLLMPLWLQTQIGYTATWAGLVAAPTGAIAVMLTPLTARMMARVDARIIATVAFLAFGASYFMRAGLTADAAFFNFVLPLLVQGIAMATFFLSMITLLLDGIPPQRIPSASGVSNFVRITAGGFAASIVTTLWDRREALHQSRLADQTTAFSPWLRGAVANLHRLGLPELGAQASITRTMVGQAYLLAADDIFYASGWICLVLIAMVWMCRKAKSGGGAPVAAD